tara:strand:- start:378 stop:695 length:318 start_codon:yes stop_codon:yes gene_type:complete
MSNQNQSFKLIEIEELKDISLNNDITYIDVRDEQSFNDSHIPDAKNINQTNIKQFLSATEIDRHLVIYCYHGNSSRNAAQYFISQGFKNIYSLEGGFEAYKASVE